MSLVDEKVTSIKVLANGISTDFESRSVNASEGVLHMAMHVGDVVVVLRISGKLKARKSLLRLFAYGPCSW